MLWLSPRLVRSDIATVDPKIAFDFSITGHIKEDAVYGLFPSSQLCKYTNSFLYLNDFPPVIALN